MDQISAIAGAHQWLAIAWHIAIIIAALILVRWRPSARQAIWFAVAPVASVSLVSAAHGAWFNAISLGLLALVVAGSSVNLVQRWRTCVPGWSSWLGLGLVAFGAWYPHFTPGAWYRVLYAAPVGLAPCPTLAVVAGFALLAGGFGSRALPAILAVWTAFYGVFGVAVLGVDLDLVLIVASLASIRLALHNARVCNLGT